jgi:hypothetical protein
VTQGKQDAKVLGLVWNIKDDLLKYKVKVEICKTQQPKFTKRIYDPIGFTAPYLVRAKIGLQELGRKGLTGMMNCPHVIKQNGQHSLRKWSS